jgi:hypothetical protein
VGEERVFLVDAADNHHRVCPQNVHNEVGTEPVQVVGAA